MLSENPNMTATQVIELVNEKGMLVAPTLGRQHTEYVGGIVERERPIAGPHQPNQSGITPSLHGHGEFGTRPLIALTRAAYVIRPWASAGRRAHSRALRSWTSVAASVATASST